MTQRIDALLGRIDARIDAGIDAGLVGGSAVPIRRFSATSRKARYGPIVRKSLKSKLRQFKKQLTHVTNISQRFQRVGGASIRTPLKGGFGIDAVQRMPTTVGRIKWPENRPFLTHPQDQWGIRRPELTHELTHELTR